MIYLLRTLISFSKDSSFPFKAFLSIHLTATKCPGSNLHSAKFTRLKAPVPRTSLISYLSYKEHPTGWSMPFSILNVKTIKNNQTRQERKEMKRQIIYKNVFNMVNKIFTSFLYASTCKTRVWVWNFREARNVLYMVRINKCFVNLKYIKTKTKIEMQE